MCVFTLFDLDASTIQGPINRQTNGQTNALFIKSISDQRTDRQSDLQSSVKTRVKRPKRKKEFVKNGRHLNLKTTSSLLRHLKNVSCFIRIPLFIVMGYVWEYVCGFVLRCFDACPWDYRYIYVVLPFSVSVLLCEWMSCLGVPLCKSLLEIPTAENAVIQKCDR